MSETFSAALIAGGRSRRMGTDKAFLAWEGRPLWEYQMAKLQGLTPHELFLSCRTEQNFPAVPDIIPVEDEWPDAGPLGGVGSCLRICSAPLLVVLGIDLPLLPAALLRHLLTESTPNCGAVIMNSEGEYYEPLAAVYPRAMLAVAEEQIAGGRLSMQAFIRSGVERGLLHTPSQTVERDWFKNMNTPDDLRSL